MKVSELIEALQAYPQDALVVLSSDEEGNKFSPLENIDPGIYEADSPLDGEFFLAGDLGNPEYAQPGPVDGVKVRPAVCLWPRI